MSETTTERTPLFESRADVRIGASADEVYALVSDLPRCGEWSPECQGGTWVSGRPGSVGAVFRGENFRAPDVVSWAPVVRGHWTTEAEVVAAEPGRTFRWAMRTTAGQRQESVWAFDLEPVDGGVVLTHHFRMDAPTEGIRKIVSGMDDGERAQFFAEWGAKVEKDLAATVERIKDIVEQN